MQNAPVDRNGTLARNIEVREIRCKNKIIRSDGGTEQQGAGIPQFQGQGRKMACSVIKQTFLSQAGRLHIAKAVEDEEHAAVLEDPRAVVRPGLGCRYVVLGVCDSISIQFNTSFPTLISVDFG
jgi:hypothetical protein